jgi:hypothetical protein
VLLVQYNITYINQTRRISRGTKKRKRFATSGKKGRTGKNNIFSVLEYPQGRYPPGRTETFRLVATLKNRQDAVGGERDGARNFPVTSP